MIILIDKQEKTGYICQDMTTISKIMGVHRMTIKRRLPYFEDNRYVLTTGDPEKSRRGGRFFVKM